MMEISRLWGEKPDWLWGEGTVQQARLLAWYRVWCNPKAKTKSTQVEDQGLNEFGDMASRDVPDGDFPEDEEDWSE